MKKTIISLVLFCLSFSALACTKIDARIIYWDLRKANHLPPIKLNIVRSNVLNAYYLDNNIYITTRIIKYCKNRDELALIIGHELSHKKYIEELKADISGTKYGKKAGFNMRHSVSVFYRLWKKMGEPDNNDPHPRWEVRIKAVKDTAAA